MPQWSVGEFLCPKPFDRPVRSVWKRYEDGWSLGWEQWTNSRCTEPMQTWSFSGAPVQIRNQLWHSLQEKSLVSDLDTNQLRGASDCGRAAERQVLCCAAAIHPVSSRPATPHNHSVTRWITLWITLSRLPFYIFSHLLTSLHWMLKEAAFWLFVQMCCSVENWPRDLCCTRELCHCLPLVVVYKVTGDCKAQTEKLPRLKAGAAPDHKVHCGWGPYFFRLWRKCEKMAGRTWHLVLILFGWGSKMEVCRRSMIRGIQCSRFLLNWTLLFSSSSLSLPPDAPGWLLWTRPCKEQQRFATDSTSI